MNADVDRLFGTLIHLNTVVAKLEGQGRRSKVTVTEVKDNIIDRSTQQLMEWPTVTEKQTYIRNCK